METSQLKALKNINKTRHGKTKDKKRRKWLNKQEKVHVQLALGTNFHTPREVVTFRHNFTTHGGWTNCHRGVGPIVTSDN
jgi:hypothetical protein